MALKSSQDGIYDINIVPFVDIVLVLLVITMLMAPTLYQSSVRVELPTAFQATSNDKITFHFLLNKQKDLFLDGKKIVLEDLEELYNKARSLDPAVDAVINADKEISHGDVMQVIDRLRQAGMNNIAIGAIQK